MPERGMIGPTGEKDPASVEEINRLADIPSGQSNGSQARRFFGCAVSQFRWIHLAGSERGQSIEPLAHRMAVRSGPNGRLNRPSIGRRLETERVARLSD